MRFTGGEHKIVAFVPLKNSPHPLDVFQTITLVAFRVEVPQKQFVLQPVLDRAHGAGNFPADRCFAASWAFMVEQNAIVRAKPIALEMIDRRRI